MGCYVSCVFLVFDKDTGAKTKREDILETLGLREAKYGKIEDGRYSFCEYKGYDWADRVYDSLSEKYPLVWFLDEYSTEPNGFNIGFSYFNDDFREEEAKQFFRIALKGVVKSNLSIFCGCYCVPASCQGCKHLNEQDECDMNDEQKTMIEDMVIDTLLNSDDSLRNYCLCPYQEHS